MSTFYPKTAPPRASLFMSHYSFNSPKKLHQKCILEHPFNHKVQIFLPSAISESFKILTDKLLQDTHYYHAHIPLSLFLTSAFMQYSRNGMIALSVQGGIDTHDVVCLNGKGKLILSLTKDTYEQMGINGVPSKFRSDRQRYVVEIDLHLPSMVPGKAMFERIKWCFENTLTTVFPMVLASVDPEGLSLPLEFPEATRARQLSFNVKYTPLDNILIPDTTSMRTVGKNDFRWRKNVAEIYEWIGMASLQSERIVAGDSVDAFLCVYSTPSQTLDDIAPSSGCLMEIAGFIPSKCVINIFEALRSLLNNSSGLPWANFTTYGFQDAPISWQGREHGYLVSGENMYSFFLWSRHHVPAVKECSDDGVYILLESVAAHDAHS